MKLRALLVCASALAAAVTMAPAAFANNPAPDAAAPVLAGLHGTGPWTGYAVVAHPNVKLRYAATDFTVPTVTCTSTNSKASFWVGLDGLGDRTVEQVGVSTDCHTGRPIYQAWWEMFPAETNYMFPVFPGDSIQAAVFYNYGTGVYDLSIADTTHHVSFLRTTHCGSGLVCNNTTAEVILEADNGTNLSRFTRVNFTNSVVTSRNGTHGAYQNTSLWDLREPLMTGSNGRVLANVSGLSNGGENFSVTFNEAR